MRLKLSKYAFDLSAGKFLGFMVTQKGIEVNPDQIKVVMKTLAPSNKKELQRLTGKLVALGRFIARFIDKLRHFFLVLRKANATGWTDNCQSAFIPAWKSYRSRTIHLIRDPLGESSITKGLPHSWTCLFPASLFLPSWSAARSCYIRLGHYHWRNPFGRLFLSPLRASLFGWGEGGRGGGPCQSLHTRVCGASL